MRIFSKLPTISDNELSVTFGHLFPTATDDKLLKVLSKRYTITLAQIERVRAVLNSTNERAQIGAYRIGFNGSKS